jgi:hypothetical protein
MEVFAGFERERYPEGERGAVLSELESYKAVDEETPAGSRGETTLYSHKVRKYDRSKRHNPCIENKRKDRKSHIKIKECDNLLASDRCVFRSYMEYHNSGHDEGSNVNETGSWQISLQAFC